MPSDGRPEVPDAARMEDYARGLAKAQTRLLFTAEGFSAGWNREVAVEQRLGRLLHSVDSHHGGLAPSMVLEAAEALWERHGGAAGAAPPTEPVAAATATASAPSRPQLGILRGDSEDAPARSWKGGQEHPSTPPWSTSTSPHSAGGGAASSSATRPVPSGGEARRQRGATPAAPDPRTAAPDLGSADMRQHVARLDSVVERVLLQFKALERQVGETASAVKAERAAQHKHLTGLQARVQQVELLAESASESQRLVSREVRTQRSLLEEVLAETSRGVTGARSEAAPAALPGLEEDLDAMREKVRALEARLDSELQDVSERLAASSRRSADSEHRPTPLDSSACSSPTRFSPWRPTDSGGVRSDLVERLEEVERSAERHARELRTVKDAGDRHSKGLHEVKLKVAQTAALPERMEYLEQQLEETCGRHRSEILSLQAAVSKHDAAAGRQAQDLEELRASIATTAAAETVEALERSVGVLERSLGDAAGRREVAQLRAEAERRAAGEEELRQALLSRVGALERCVGDVADRRSVDAELGRLGSALERRATEAAAMQVAVEARLEQLEARLGDASEHDLEESRGVRASLEALEAQLAQQGEADSQESRKLRTSVERLEAELAQQVDRESRQLRSSLDGLGAELAHRVTAVERALADAAEERRQESSGLRSAACRLDEAFERMDAADRRQEESAEQLTADLQALVEATTRAAQEVAALKASQARLAALEERLQGVEDRAGAEAEQRAAEARELREAQARHAQALARHAAEAAAAAERCTSVEERVAYAEELLGDSLDQRSMEMRALTVAHDNYVSSLAGRGGARASLPQRVDSVERMASDSANVAGAQAKELEALRAAHSEHERQEKEVAEGLSQVHAGQAELLERLIAIGSHVDRTEAAHLERLEAFDRRLDEELAAASRGLAEVYDRQLSLEAAPAASAEDLEALREALREELREVEERCAPLPLRLDYLDQALADLADRQAQELRDLCGGIDEERRRDRQSLKELEERSEAVGEQLRAAEESLAGCTGAVSRIGSTTDRVAYLEELLGDSVERRRHDRAQILRASAPPEPIGFIERADRLAKEIQALKSMQERTDGQLQAMAETRLRYVEAWLDGPARRQAEELETLGEEQARLAEDVAALRDVDGDGRPGDRLRRLEAIVGGAPRTPTASSWSPTAALASPARRASSPGVLVAEPLAAQPGLGASSPGLRASSPGPYEASSLQQRLEAVEAALRGRTEELRQSNVAAGDAAALLGTVRALEDRLAEAIERQRRDCSDLRESLGRATEAARAGAESRAAAVEAALEESRQWQSHELAMLLASNDRHAAELGELRSAVVEQGTSQGRLQGRFDYLEQSLEDASAGQAAELRSALASVASAHSKHDAELEALRTQLDRGEAAHEPPVVPAQSVGLGGLGGLRERVSELERLLGRAAPWEETDDGAGAEPHIFERLRLLRTQLREARADADAAARAATDAAASAAASAEAATEASAAIGGRVSAVESALAEVTDAHAAAEEAAGSAHEACAHELSVLALAQRQQGGEVARLREDAASTLGRIERLERRAVALAEDPEGSPRAADLVALRSAASSPTQQDAADEPWRQAQEDLAEALRGAEQRLARLEAQDAADEPWRQAQEDLAEAQRGAEQRLARLEAQDATDEPWRQAQEDLAEAQRGAEQRLARLEEAVGDADAPMEEAEAAVVPFCERLDALEEALAGRGPEPRGGVLRRLDALEVAAQAVAAAGGGRAWEDELRRQAGDIAERVAAAVRAAAAELRGEVAELRADAVRAGEALEEARGDGAAALERTERLEQSLAACVQTEAIADDLAELKADASETRRLLLRVGDDAATALARAERLEQSLTPREPGADAQEDAAVLGGVVDRLERLERAAEEAAFLGGVVERLERLERSPGAGAAPTEEIAALPRRVEALEGEASERRAQEVAAAQRLERLERSLGEPGGSAEPVASLRQRLAAVEQALASEVAHVRAAQGEQEARLDRTDEALVELDAARAPLAERIGALERALGLGAGRGGDSSRTPRGAGGLAEQLAQLRERFDVHAEEARELQVAVASEKAAREGWHTTLERRLGSVERGTDGAPNVKAVLEGLQTCRTQVRESREACEHHLSVIAQRLDHLETVERLTFGAGPQGVEGRLRRLKDDVATLKVATETIEVRMYESQERLEKLFEVWAGGTRDELSFLARQLAQQARAEARTLVPARSGGDAAAGEDGDVGVPGEPIAYHAPAPAPPQYVATHNFAAGTSLDLLFLRPGFASECAASSGTPRRPWSAR